MNAAVRFEEPLSAHTAYRTGGTCTVWVVAHDDDAVVQVLSECKAVRWSVVVVGTGSRVLIRDGGITGCVLKLGSGFHDLAFVDDVLVIGGAVKVGTALAYAAARGFVADPLLYAVMGTFGASARLDPWDLQTVDLARTQGVRTLPADKVGPKSKGVVVRGQVRMEQVGEVKARARVKAAWKKHPPGAWFSGGRGLVRKVVRRAALNQVRLRNVAIPEGSPEMLVNLGGGSASDLLLLQKSAIERVKRTRGVNLATTMKWVGDKS